jgi:hypothetical protein
MLLTGDNGSEISGVGPLRLELQLVVTDPDIVRELLKHDDREERNEYALVALKVGVLAIKQASGVLDACTIHDECDRFLKVVNTTLSNHIDSVSSQVGTILGRYFDSTQGEFNQRIDRLVRRDGELETLLSRYLNGDSSSLAQTLEKHIGPNSPLLQMLSPDQRKGILAALQETVDSLLDEHRKAISRQFSLDDKDSALSRLVSEITDQNGTLRKDLATDLESVQKEFSLDNETGALARLVSKVERAHRTILSEFSADNEQSALSRMARLLENTNNNIDASLSLDKEHSPLSRLRRELLNVFGDMEKNNKDFQEQVRVTLESLKTRREEAARSTSHGLDFEDSVGEFIQREAQRLGDLFIGTGDTGGTIPRCKIGDFVVVLGPDTAAENSRIVFEAKENKSYTTKDALDELRVARENREAPVGIFVFSRSTAPSAVEPLNRWGQDILVIWDAEDPTTDVYFKAAISMARLMVVQTLKASKESTACIEEIDASVNTLTRDVGILDDIVRMAQTVKNNGENIIGKADSLRKKIEKQLETLREQIGALRAERAT